MYNANQYITEDDETESAKIDKHIAAICKKYGIVVKQLREIKHLHCLSHVRRILKRDGEDCLCWIFDVIEKSHWSDNYNNAYFYENIVGLRNIYKNHTDDLEATTQKIVNVLRHTSPNEVKMIQNTKFKNSEAHTGYFEALESLVA